MKLAITKGMDGDEVEVIGKYSTRSIGKMLSDFYSWKQNADRSKYHVSSYDRQLFNDENKKIVIDFGDYSYFGLIDDCSKKEYDAVINFSSRPVDLEV